MMPPSVPGITNFCNPPFTHSCDFTTIIPIKPRYEKGSRPIGVLIEQIGKLWSSFRPFYEAPTSNAYCVYCPQHSRSYYDVTQSFYCAFTTIMKISPRCFHAACTIAALLLRSFYDSTPILVGHDPVTLVLSMFKISVARA
ncbi:hypothetical protein DPMN_110808 [Dreissena polymorpha]|uniref:Uncharacterized protein n=1 Tax=Dreissena polymorpha TaxID=45954 RepID=A0A9D4QNF1_DREPO|nr:hypothetical protein DPMN_110808 [Dreissena polymorpha]